MAQQIRTKPQLGVQIRELRLAQGLSQAQLGEKLGLSQARISRIEKSPERISVGHLMLVLAVLDASLSVEPTLKRTGSALKASVTNKCRVAVFGSFYRGYYLLNELLHGPISELVTVVGVATDSPESPHISAHKRVWQYPHSRYEKVMVADLAREHGIDVFDGPVNADPFHDIFENKWRPDVCVMATFGQRIRKRLIKGPPLGFYNLHPCIDDAWPSKYAGGNPFEALLRDGQRYACVVFHGIDEGFDTGPFVARTEKIAMPGEATVTDMHKITSFAAAQLASRELLKIIARGPTVCG